jgi:uncharacterized protein (TIGR03435 family)
MRIETQSQALYVLRFARRDKRFGPNLRVSTNDEACRATDAAFVGGGKASQPKVCQPHVEHAPDRLVVRDSRFGSIVRNEFPHHVDRPVVVDDTGLTNYVDFELRFAPIAGADWDEQPFDLHAVEEQLGLALVPATRRVGVMVIDSVSQPAAN